MRLGIIEYIDSAHYLPGHETCSRVHGHTYRVELVVEGEKKGGMVIDFYDLKKVLREVLKEFDHRPLNDLLEYPSCENLCEAVHGKLRGKIDLPFTLRVWEGKDKWVEL